MDCYPFQLDMIILTTPTRPLLGLTSLMTLTSV